MTIAVVYSPTAEGRAALTAAAAESLLRHENLVVAGGSEPLTVEQTRSLLGAAAGRMDEAALEVRVGHSRLTDPSDAVIQIAQDCDASLLVLGLRRRSPVGKLILGSLAQRVLIEATCPVLAVKA